MIATVNAGRTVEVVVANHADEDSGSYQSASTTLTRAQSAQLAAFLLDALAGDPA